MKNILFISYYFPPCANSGSHRVLALARGLKKYDYSSFVLTVKDGYWGRNPRLDQQLIHEFPGKIYRIPLFYPGKKWGNGFIARLVRRLWAEITIPDGFIIWARLAYYKSIEIIKKEKIDFVFITAPPFSSFLIGLFIKKRVKITVAIDYRDPWTGNSYYQPRKWKHFFCQKLEKKILDKLDSVFTVTGAMTDYVKQNAGPAAGKEKFKTLTYFFPGTKNRPINTNMNSCGESFRLIFAGRKFGVADPLPLLKALLLLKEKREDIYEKIEIISVGDLMAGQDDWINANNLGSKVKIFDYMTYEKAMGLMAAAKILLLPYAIHDHTRVCLPVKIFDYFKLGKPILFYGPEGQMWDTLKKTRQGWCHNPADIRGICDSICEIHDLYCRQKNGILELETSGDEINKFSEDYIIRRFIHELSNL